MPARENNSSPIDPISYPARQILNGLSIKSCQSPAIYDRLPMDWVNDKAALGRGNAIY